MGDNLLEADETAAITIWLLDRNAPSPVTVNNSIAVMDGGPEGGDGIDPTREHITLKVGDYDLVIEAGSFILRGERNYWCKGTIDDDGVGVSITKKRNGTFSFSVSITRADLRDLQRSSELTLRIINDYGEKDVKVRGIKH